MSESESFELVRNLVATLDRMWGFAVNSLTQTHTHTFHIGMYVHTDTHTLEHLVRSATLCLVCERKALMQRSSGGVGFILKTLQVYLPPTHSEGYCNFPCRYMYINILCLCAQHSHYLHEFMCD